MMNSVTNAVTQLQNETAFNPRSVGGSMGKEDFLMLLSTQLRYQNPLEPVSDSDFAAQLAQFSALEQMQNISDTLTAMLSLQAFSLTGKFVSATAAIDGEQAEIAGVVDCVFTEKGVLYAQIGEYVVPLSAISEVYDDSSLLTPKMLVEASNNLLGHTVVGSLNGQTVEGVVTRVVVDNGVMYAVVIDREGETRTIRVETIYDIRKTEEAKPAENSDDEEDTKKINDSDDQENPAGPDYTENAVDDPYNKDNIIDG